MKKKFRLIPAVVMSVFSAAFLKSYIYQFYNAVREKRRSQKNSDEEVKFCLFCDSGGYQVYITEKKLRENKSAKKWRIEPWVGIRNTKEYLIIDPIDVCRIYGKLGIRYGFTVDIPLCENATEQEFENSLLESFKWAKLMFRFRNRLCPETYLLVPLHYHTQQQLYRSYEIMAQLNPDGYAIPVRNTSNWEDMVRIACSMCFLHHKGVERFHMLGSSRPEIIILGAAAVGLKLFHKVSFDSRTWNTAMYSNPPKYLDPKTLRPMSPLGRQHIELVLPRSINDKLRKEAKGHSLSFDKDLILLHNIMATYNYAQAMVKRAQNLEHLKRYVKNSPHLNTQRDRLITTINLLSTLKRSGYDLIEDWLRWLWS